jgi:hypothetical protein
LGENAETGDRLEAGWNLGDAARELGGEIKDSGRPTLTSDTSSIMM